MQAGPFLEKEGERGGSRARVGIFGYSQALRPVLGEPHGGANLHTSLLSTEPPGASWPISSLPSFVGLMHAVSAGQAAA